MPASSKSTEASQKDLEKRILNILLSADWNMSSTTKYFYHSESYRFEDKAFTNYVSFGPLGIAGVEHSVSYQSNGTWQFVKIGLKDFTIALDYQKQPDRDQQPRQVMTFRIVNNDLLIDDKGQEYKKIPNT